MIKKYLFSNQYVLGAVVLLVCYVIYKSWTRISLIISKVRVSSELSARGASAAVVEINLQELADEIYIAFHEQFIPFTEDEERAIAALRMATNRNVLALSVLYAKHGKNMFTDFQTYLSKEQYEQIRNLLIY